MNSKDLRNINEAYSSIYEEQIEAGQHPGKSPDKRTRDKFETKSRQGTAPKGVGVPDKSVGYGQLKQDVDMFELIKGHLMSEGFADSEEAAHAIMANMSEQWMDNIVEATARVLAPKGGVAGSVQVKQTTTKTPGFLGTGIGSKTKTTSTPVPGTWTRSTPGREKLGPREFDAYGSGSKGAEAEMSDRSGPTDAERERFNHELTKKHTKKSPYDDYHRRTTGSTEPSPRGVNRRANAAGHSGLMPTRKGIRYTKPNRSDRGY